MHDTTYSQQYENSYNGTGLPRAYLRPEQGDPCWSRAMTSHNHQTADTALLEAVKEDRIDDVCCEFCCVCVCGCE